MWIAMLCSVTVSIGEDGRGAFRVNRLETLDSRSTSETGKAAGAMRTGERDNTIESLTDLPGQDEEVIVGQSPVFAGVEQRIHVQAISGLIFLEDIQIGGLIQGLRHGCSDGCFLRE